MIGNEKPNKPRARETAATGSLSTNFMSPLRSMTSAPTGTPSTNRCTRTAHVNC